ncbi:hypothetical protein QMK33_23270, partial [Hymenobacter sp. H14-R3]|uniref:hypothetical protein n=1 Tax=Hymenobacter sp. H14-R3 TaxID=3046308 RepID=UPI0024B8C0DA
REDGLKPVVGEAGQGISSARELFRREDGLKPAIADKFNSGQPLTARELFRREDGLKLYNRLGITDQDERS